MAMNISILASIGCQNLGDELILKNEIKLLREVYFKGEEIKFKIFTYDIEKTYYVNNDIECIEYFPIGIRNPKNIIRNINNLYYFIETILRSDLVVFGGGGIIYNNEIGTSKGPINSRLIRKKIIDFIGRQIMFFGVGINLKGYEIPNILDKDIETDKTLRKIDKLFSGVSEIYVRDDYSKQLLDKIGINSKQIKDPVYYDKGLDISQIDNKLCLGKLDASNLDIESIDKKIFDGKRVGLAFRRGFFGGNEEAKVSNLIDYLEKAGATIILLPHSFHPTDKASNDYLFLNKFVRPISKSIDESYGIYKHKSIDLCLAERFHSIVLCQVYGIPYIGISYSKKTDELLK